MEKKIAPEVLKVLEFYADPGTYAGIGFFPDDPCGAFVNDFGPTELDMKPGKRARELLDKLSDEGLITLSGLASAVEICEKECDIGLDEVMHKLTQEMGELNDAIQKRRGKYCRSRVTDRDLRKEFGDVLLNLISLCWKMGIDPDDLPEIAQETLLSFGKRIAEYQACLKDSSS